MAGFMKNAMQYLGMADVAEDDEPMDILPIMGDSNRLRQVFADIRAQP